MKSSPYLNFWAVVHLYSIIEYGTTYVHTLGDDAKISHKLVVYKNAAWTRVCQNRRK
jgi:hypothetical protein